jgi:hypothetical protein
MGEIVRLEDAIAPHISHSIHTVIVGLEKEGGSMVKVSIEVHSGTARFAVAIKARSIRQALSLVSARHPSSVTRVHFPIDPEGFFVEDSAA